MWVTDNNIKYELDLGAMAIQHADVWFIEYHKARLLCMDKETGIVKKSIALKKLPLKRHNIFGGIMVSYPWVYAFPYKGSILVQYNVEDDSTEYIFLNQLYATKDNYLYFISGAVVGKCLFLFSKANKEIVCYDTVTKKVNLISHFDNVQSANLFTRRNAVDKDIIWIAEDNSNRILKVDTQTLKAKWIFLPRATIVDICLYKDTIYCLDASGKIFEVNKNTEQTELIADIKEERYGFIEKTENYIWLIPTNLKPCIRYSEQQEMERIEYPAQIQESKYKFDYYNRVFCGVAKDEENILTVVRGSNCYIEIDRKNEELFFRDMLCAEEVKKMVKEDFEEDIVAGKIEEERYSSLDWLLELLSKKES